LKKRAVVLFNLGGPDSLKTIEPFLFNLFSDPDIFKIPFFQGQFAKLISRLRAPKVAGQYEKIGGKSPLNEWTEIQRGKLEDLLRKDIPGIDVFTAMRYWKPLSDETAEKVKAGNYDEILLLPQYPHYSIVTTGSSFNEWNRKFRPGKAKQLLVEEYCEHPLYLQALNERIDQALAKFPEDKRNKVVLMFSAHSTPESLWKKGDPYRDQIVRTMNAIIKLRRNDLEHHLCFQSKVGPVKWLGPSTEESIQEMIKTGKKNLLLIPVSFVSDHIETLFELGVEYRHVAEEAGVENYIVTEGFNGGDTYVQAMAVIARKYFASKF